MRCQRKAHVSRIAEKGRVRQKAVADNFDILRIFHLLELLLWKFCPACQLVVKISYLEKHLFGLFSEENLFIP